MPSLTRKTRLCQLPSPGNIAGRSSSITNAFFNSIIPIHEPSEAEVLEALNILEMDWDDIRCAYCGDKCTEWDHLRPIITGKRPTGYITEIANLVPSCGKCNQSKGKRHWREWMFSSARLSPASRNVADIEDRAERLLTYTLWRPPTVVDFAALIKREVWHEHQSNWRKVLDLLKVSQELAKQIRATIEAAPRHYNEATGQTTYGKVSEPVADASEPEVYLDHEEVFADLKRHLSEAYPKGKAPVVQSTWPAEI
jgi:hypothetical protein